MKNILLVFMICLTPIAINSQMERGKIELSFERFGDTLKCFVSNSDIIPRTIEFDDYPKLENYKINPIFKKSSVILENTPKSLLYFLIPINKNKKTNCTFSKYWDIQGNTTLQIQDINFSYSLPFQSGKSFTVYQGYNGIFSHQNKLAIDFTMPEGTPIYAAREGIVIKVIDTNTAGCPSKNCANLGNYISIYHKDGTIADYFHLKYKGANVKVGDKVTTETLIGYSGNTGWSSGPHLHFECYFARRNENKTLKTYFKINDGKKAELLAEKKSYFKNY